MPPDSGPYISTILPFGTPPTPSARSSPNEPDGNVSTLRCALSPSFITAPLPYAFSICAIAFSSAFILLSSLDVVTAVFAILFILSEHKFILIIITPSNYSVNYYLSMPDARYHACFINYSLTCHIIRHCGTILLNGYGKYKVFSMFNLPLINTYVNITLTFVFHNVQMSVSSAVLNHIVPLHFHLPVLYQVLQQYYLINACQGIS